MNTRLDYLDAVRAFALLLGIVFHAALSFLPTYIGWAVMDISTSPFVKDFMMLSHAFRMPLFFLIAGFFSHRVLHGKGAGVFIKSRLVRIGIPFLIGWFIMKPLLVSCWVMGNESMRGDVHILAGLKIGFQSLGELPNGLFAGSHLWFLYYLMLVTASLLAIRYLMLALPRVKHALLAAADRTLSWTANKCWVLPLLALPTALCLWKMSNWGLDTPDRSLVPHMPVLLLYGSFFTLGWLLDRQPETINSFAHISLGRIVFGIIAIAVTLYFSRFQNDPGHPQYTAYRAGFIAGYACMIWALVMLTIGLFKRFCDKPNQAIRYIADSSYWLYLVHLPIVIWLQIAFAEFTIHWSLKLFAISTITIALSLLMYDLFVRSTLIGKVLNGRRKPRVIFASSAKTSSKGTLSLQPETSQK